MSLLLLSLEELENTIVGYISNGAYMIYWNHRMDIFDHLLESDVAVMTQNHEPEETYQEGEHTQY